MRSTIVIIALIGLMSLMMDAVQEAGTAPVHALPSSETSIQDFTVAATTLDTDAVEKGSRNQGPAHLMEIKGVSELGTLLLLGVALSGLIWAPQRKTQKSRVRRGIT
ncbi:hypothetical protein [Nitrosospira sp. NpAV]|uniref:hypothetical protein n=1 Tax=Nitrosospira sp. NpAV TaxID=58133 RepID=UPI0005A12E95|nr:hypothetical protein [Nitrosospira sp. NpAV]KIO48434.1 hypothetical protein SQ11_11900 [Nitrosospira sp. NpAV]